MFNETIRSPRLKHELTNESILVYLLDFPQNFYIVEQLPVPLGSGNGAERPSSARSAPTFELGPKGNLDRPADNYATKNQERFVCAKPRSQIVDNGTDNRWG